VIQSTGAPAPELADGSSSIPTAPPRAGATTITEARPNDVIVAPGRRSRSDGGTTVLIEADRSFTSCRPDDHRAALIQIYGDWFNHGTPAARSRWRASWTRPLTQIFATPTTTRHLHSTFLLKRARCSRTAQHADAGVSARVSTFGPNGDGSDTSPSTSSGRRNAAGGHPALDGQSGSTLQHQPREARARPQTTPDQRARDRGA